jgi:hypothetical protein
MPPSTARFDAGLILGLTAGVCVVHMVRNSLRYASKRHWPAITKAMRAIYTAPTVPAAEVLFAGFAADWRGRRRGNEIGCPAGVDDGAGWAAKGDGVGQGVHGELGGHPLGDGVAEIRLNQASLTAHR